MRQYKFRLNSQHFLHKTIKRKVEHALEFWKRLKVIWDAGAMTLSTTFNISPLSIMKHSIVSLFATLIIYLTQHNDTQNNSIECYYAECCYAECCYAECCYAECCYAECCYAECSIMTISVMTLSIRIKHWA